MADERERADEGKEPLTEREREALKTLAREIVREAGLVSDPEAEAEAQRKEDLLEAGRRNAQAHLEFYKHMTTLSGASMAAAIAVFGAFLKEENGNWLFYVSVCMIAVALALAGGLFGLLSTMVGTRRIQGESWRDLSEGEFRERLESVAGLMQWDILGITLLWYLGISGLVGSVLIS